MMHVKILIILVLAVLVAGCTGPDIPDPREWWNVTPEAPAFSKEWDEETQTISMVSPVDVTLLTIEKVSAEPDLCIFTEILNVTAHVNYNLNAAKDFVFGWVQHSGKNGVTNVDISKLVNESYEVVVDEYEIVQVNTSVYNNETGLNETVTTNQTAVTGNHTETRYRDVWQAWTPAGNTLFAGESVLVKIVYHKKAELGDVRIQTIPMFAGVECEELTWWNTSWDHKREIKINNTGGSALTYYQVYMDLTATPINSTSLRVVNETADATVPHWQETISSENCTGFWFNATAIPASSWLNETYCVYYSSLGAATTSDGASTFIRYHGAASSQFIDALNVPSGALIYEGRVKATAATHTLKWGLSKTQTGGSDDGEYIISYTGNNNRYVRTNNGASQSDKSETPSFTQNIYYRLKIINTGTAVTGFVDDNQIGTGDITTDLPNENMGIYMQAETGTGAQNWSFVRKYIANEPTYSIGAEENQSIITAYTPSTPLQKTTGDSQLFTVNTSENSQCRWYINGSLKQTNSTGATRHEYTNTSLDEGYWNFTATANTTDMTSSQTWWVTVSAVGTFGQDMYVDRWMYATYLSGSNTNLSEFFTDLAPYYLSFYNATDQKTYNYKSGRWEKYADKIIKPGEAAMLRYTLNITKTRDNAGGTFGFTMKTGLNHIGHSYNGSRNLAWYNTTISSANLVTIAHQNPETGALSTFTYGSTDNGSVDVLQGCGVEVNVSADTVISGL